MTEQQYEPQGSAKLDNAPEAFKEQLAQVRLWVRRSGSEYNFVCGYKPEAGESRVLEIPTNEQEITSTVTEWLGAKTAATVLSQLSAEESGKFIRVTEEGTHVHLYTTRARAAFLAMYEQEVLSAPDADVTHLFPVEREGSYNRPRLSPEQWAAKNAVAELQGLVDDDIITEDQMLARLVKKGHLKHLL